MKNFKKNKVNTQQPSLYSLNQHDSNFLDDEDINSNIIMIPGGGGDWIEPEKSQIDIEKILE